MLFRKTRTHFMGASNRSSDSLSRSNNNFLLHKSTSNFKHVLASTEVKNPFTSSIKKRSKKSYNFNNTQHGHKHSLSFQQEGSEAGQIQQKLRKIFKNSKDMVKLLNHWGFDQKGFISREHFHKVINKKVGADVEDKDIEIIMKRHSGNEDHINSQGVIQMLMGRTDGIPIDTMNLPIQHNNSCREALVDNLKEDVKNYKRTTNTDISDHNINRLLSKFNTSVSRMRQTPNCHIPADKSQFFIQLKNNNTFNSFEEKLIDQIEKTVDFKEMQALLQRHKNADYLFVDPIVRNTSAEVKNKIGMIGKKTSMTQADMGSTFGQKMKSLPNLLQRTLKSEDKRAPFDPISLLNIDQRKTRFQGSKFTAQGSGWFANTQTISVKPDQNDKVMHVLKQEVALKQARYENKLAKMRLNRKIQQENIMMREQSSKQTEVGRLQRIRDQQQAYNYINFIKKRWQ